MKVSQKPRSSSSPSFPELGTIYFHIPSKSLIYSRGSTQKGFQITGPSAVFGAEWTFTNAVPENYVRYDGTITLENN